jgi:two-component system, response regulator
MSDCTVDILLVEDNPNDIELAVYAFTKQNIIDRVRIVRDGVEALDFIFCEGEYKQRDHREGPKIIMLDLKIPKISGLEVLQRVKSDPRTKRIPVIALTTSHEFRDVNTCYLLGVNSYITKPVDFDEFSFAITLIRNYWLGLNLFPVEHMSNII